MSIGGIGLSRILSFASARLQDDYDTVLEIVQIDGLSLEFASDRLKNDHSIVLAAVRNHPMALKYAGENFKDDATLVSEAIRHNYAAIYHASNRLRSNLDFVKECMHHVNNGDTSLFLSLCDSTIRENPEFLRFKSDSCPNAALANENFFRDFGTNLFPKHTPQELQNMLSAHLDELELTQFLANHPL